MPYTNSYNFKICVQRACGGQKFPRFSCGVSAPMSHNGLFPKSLFGLKILRLWKENIGLNVSELKVLVNHREMFASVPEYKSRRICSENKALLLTQRWGGIFQKWGPRSYWAPSNKKVRGPGPPGPPVPTPMPHPRRHNRWYIQPLDQLYQEEPECQLIEGWIHFV